MSATAASDALLLAAAAAAANASGHAAQATADQPAPGLHTGLGSSPAGGSGGSGGGFAPIFFLAILTALVGLARLSYERLRLPSFTWRPVAFVSLLERPG
jgi:hypothetical protein